MLTERVLAWQRGGEIQTAAGHEVFVRRQSGTGPRLVFLHGYPSSSYDWRHVISQLPGRALTVFDFPGFGLSAKPPSLRYSLLLQADVVEDLIASHRDEEILLVAHDMGTSVATELLARSCEDRLSVPLGGVLLFNGSMVIEKASLTISQKVLRSRLGPIAARLSNERSFRLQFARIFSREHPLSPDEAADQWALLAHDGGHRILDRLTYYLHERVDFADRWHGALRQWPGRLELAWAERDPICTEAVLQAVLQLRPHAPLTRVTGIGHYPQLEDPGAVTRIIERFAAGCGGSKPGPSDEAREQQPAHSDPR